MSNKNNNVLAQAQACDVVKEEANNLRINTQVSPDYPWPIPQNIDNMIPTLSIGRSMRAIFRPLLTHDKCERRELRTNAQSQNGCFSKRDVM